ncbi:LysR family transcriptional regulator [Pseudobutyrivibrio xylanivorans]|uniref:DNA-binding transcriptional regulator, LysR family n=1 Tax=Pseudobutyrivibrio xylanivorans TaxID=185007 RepID=A0A1G5RW12_PSEXY|nr:LysR family transcriptional regulator [Pseudobutyrivibrio xylanivorans]SCZ78048.1 DNA-binding transcriptional regulator, LysR family [Pseudobutyrivibrio xylanivorans]
MTLTQLRYVIVLAKENSINEAAKRLFISQPSLTAALKGLEQEIGFDIFNRSKNGISLTVKGSEFIGYARSVVEQYDILDAKYVSKSNIKRTFHVSMQHYTFAVDAFVQVIKQYGMDEYEFEIHETQTYEVIKNVSDRKSEIGVLYLNNYNKAVLEKIFKDSGIQFNPLFDCRIYAYMHKSNPLSKKKSVTLKELDDYPCLVFSQGDHNSRSFAEEVLSDYDYKQIVRASDRASMLNLMVGIKGYTLCSGIICKNLNGDDYVAVKLDEDETMTIGYIAQKDTVLSDIARKYVEELQQYKNEILL